MSVGEEAGRATGAALVESETGRTGRQEVDLDRTLGGLRAARAGRRLGGDAAVLSFPDRPKHLPSALAPDSLWRVPGPVFVSIGRGAPNLPASRPEQSRYAKRGPSDSANDNVIKKSPAARSVWRDLFFLAILAATVVGAFWSGKVQGLQKIIVVPDASTARSVVT